MANTFAPTGFQFIRNYYSGAPTYQSTWVDIAFDNSHNIGKGDPVLQLSTGYIDIAAATDSPILGIFDGCQYFDTVQQKTIYANGWLAPGNVLAGSAKAKVITDPQAVFLVQCGATGLGPIVEANIQQNAKHVVVAPSTSTGLSNDYLNFTGIADTSTFPFRIIGFGQNLNNDNTSANNYVEVIANPGTWMATTGTGI